MLEIHRSHRVEDLARQLAGLLDEPLGDPMARELLLVGSPGMARWLQAELAHLTRARGVTAIDVLFPRSYVARLADAVLGDTAPATDPWQPDLLAWSVADTVLEQLALGPGDGAPDPWTRVRRHLSRDRDDAETAVIDRRLLTLADRVARQFDRYALLRPGMVASWSDGHDIDADGGTLPPDDRWQPVLLRALEDRLPVDAPARRVARAVERLGAAAAPTGLPHRLHVFGVASLPRLHLDLLAAAARHITVHLLLPSPSPAAWERGRRGDPTPAGSVLLRSGGRIAADAATLVHAAADAAGLRTDDRLLRHSDDRDTLLASLQADVVADRPSDRDPTTGGRDLLQPDTTVRLHSCQGPLRQVEALRDDLRHRFAEDESLTPRDVVVLTPDVRRFGPLVASVFAADASSEGGPPGLPVAVADRGVADGDEVATVLLRAVRLVRARATAAAVMDLITSAPVLRSARIDPGEVRRLERWVDAVGVAWGLDADDREDAGQPRDEHHTWRAGLDRLLLGVAVPDEPDRSLGGLPPYDVEDVGDLRLLESLVVLLDHVDRLRDLDRPARPGGWHDDLVRVLDDLTGPADGLPWSDADERAAHQRSRAGVDAVLAGLRVADDAGVRELTPDAVLTWLESALEGGGGAAGYATGRMTVAGLVPLRAVPYRVVCLLGMDEGSFPRAGGAAVDDLLARAEPRPGDADARSEDRHAFLEAVLAARDALVVTWTGRDPRTGQDRTPAVPVAELRDVLDRAVAGGAAAVTVAHPALPISPRAFPAARGSFDADRADAAIASLQPARRPPPFVVGELTADDPAVPVALDDVVRAARNPARELVRRLQIAGADELRRLPASEPTELSALTRARLGARLLDWLRDGVAPDDAVARLQAEGVAPAGTPGRTALAEVRDLSVWLHGLERAYGPPEHHDVRARLGDRALEGRVRAAEHPDHGRVSTDVRYARLTPEHLVVAWIGHLTLHVALGPAWTVVARRHGRASPSTTVLAPLADDQDAATLLAGWVALRDEARRTRVAFLPGTSWEYASRHLAGEDEATARRHAGDTWEPYPDPYWSPRVAWDDPAVRLVFRDTPTFAELVERTDVLDRAVHLLAPLARCLEDGGAGGAAVAEEAPEVAA